MKQQTDVTVILDRSGSMATIKSDVIGGFNQFIEAQRREPGECLLTLVQFDHLSPFLIVLFVIGTIQIVVANVVEPAIMGRSLNLSPLVVIFSLVVWGTIWGVVGMFLCVPIMVVLLIVLAHFKATHPLAVLLSADGKVPEPSD